MPDQRISNELIKLIVFLSFCWLCLFTAMRFENYANGEITSMGLDQGRWFSVNVGDKQLRYDGLYDVEIKQMKGKGQAKASIDIFLSSKTLVLELPLCDLYQNVQSVNDNTVRLVGMTRKYSGRFGMTVENNRTNFCLYY